MSKNKSLKWKLFKIWAKEHDLFGIAIFATTFIVATVLMKIYGRPMLYICIALSILLYTYTKIMEWARKRRDG